MQSPNKGRKKREVKGEIRSSLLILDLKDESCRIQESKKKARRSINCMSLGWMMICEIEFVK